MELLKPSAFPSGRGRKTESPLVIITLSGAININGPGMKLMELHHGEYVLVAKDKHGDYFIGKQIDGSREDAYKVRAANKEKKIVFNCKGLVDQMVTEKDLALAPEKKKSIKLALNPDAVYAHGTDMYEILF